MVRPFNVAWDDVLDLRVVRALRALVEERWGVSLGFVTDQGAPVLHEGFPPLLCAPLRGPDARACFASGSPPGRPAPLGPRPCACQDGLRDMVAPILINGVVCGHVLAGAYVLAPGGDASQTRRGPDPAGPAASSGGEVASRVPMLGPTEEDTLAQVVALVALEVTHFQLEVMGAGRRADELPLRPTRYRYDEIIGRSRPMLELCALLDKVIGSDSTVLIDGENGTGKELIARAIHFNSSRKDRRFVVQNCSAFNDNLLDSELFGHKKGAFTGAISDKQGLFEVADGSTFFLDEIGDMSPSLQVKLLRVLQEGTFIPVGDTQSKQVDVRIIAATNRNLKRMVERGEFREDLYYRINVIKIRVPPLRERKEDMPALIDHFLARHAKGNRARLKKLSRECLHRLSEYNWPGNVRELENEIERLVVLAGDEKLIGVDLLSGRIREPAPDELAALRDPSGLPEAIASLERTMIYDVLKRTHWNKTRAAQELRISRRNLIRKVTKYKLDQRRAGRGS